MPVINVSTQGKFFAHPGEAGRGNAFSETMSRFRSDQCEIAGCLYELTIQLVVIMCGKQFFMNFVELALP